MTEHANVTHRIKLTSRFVRPVLDGRKRFEVRDDDRHYEVGDLVQFRTVDMEGRGFGESDFCPDYCTAEEGGALYGRRFRVTYVLHGWAIKEGYCAFGFEEATDGE